MERNSRIARALHNAMVMCAVIAIMLVLAGLSACGSAAQPDASASNSGAGSSSVKSESSAQSNGARSSQPKRDWGESGCAADHPIRVIMARGTGESANDGLLNPVSKQIGDAFAGKVQVTSLDYPATFDVDSVDTGVGKLVAMLNGQAQQCPSQRTVLLGFSQGAIVVGDALSAPKQRLDVSGNQDVLSAAAGRNVVAVAMYGDPRFNGKASYNKGTFDAGLDGSISPRGDGALRRYADRIVDFCAAKDIVCQQGGEENGHRSYFSDGSRQQGAQFVIDRLRQVVR